MYSIMNSMQQDRGVKHESNDARRVSKTERDEKITMQLEEQVNEGAERLANRCGIETDRTV